MKENQKKELEQVKKRIKTKDMIIIIEIIIIIVLIIAGATLFFIK